LICQDLQFSNNSLIKEKSFYKFISLCIREL